MVKFSRGGDLLIPLETLLNHFEASFEYKVFRGSGFNDLMIPYKLC